MRPPRSIAIPLLVLIALPLLAAAAASAAETVPPAAEAAPPTAALPRLSGAITIDGTLDEEAWKQAVVVDRFYELAPGDRAQPAVSTEGLLGYDAEFLYVGVRCADPEPAKIRAPYVDRDRVFDQDLVQIDLDARDEGRWSMIFRVNPHGVQGDGVFDEAVGSDDFSPDFHWQSAARIDAAGWTAEMRIPLSTLRYRAGEPQTWRIAFFRLYPRQFRYQIASLQAPRGSNCWLCHSPRFTGIAGLPAGGGVTMAPFASGAGSRTSGGAPSSRQRFDLGGDLKWLPHPNLAVDLTANPDFSQVESDAAQIAVNNRFALFYPEKRPFFLEGNDLWSSPIPVVHTRTITAPQWGARLTGRPGNASYTLLAAGDAGGGTLILPGPGFSVRVLQPADGRILLGRYRHNFGRSSLGAVTTVREAERGYFNRVAGVDFQWYPGDRDSVVGQVLGSSTRDPGRESAAGHALFLRWERSQRHLVWTLQLDELSRDFRADSGFVPQTGVRHLQAYSEYNLYPQGRLRRVRPRLYYDEDREPDGRVISQTSAVGIGIDGAVQAVLDWYVDDKGRAFDGTLFEQSWWNLSARFLPSRRVPLVKLVARYGDEIDNAGSRLGTGAALGLEASVSATDRLQAELSAQRHRLDVGEGRRRVRLFTATVARAKLLYTFTPRSFTRVVGEWQGLDEAGSSARDLAASALYGYRLNWQSILYAGYGNTPAGGDGRRRQEVFLKVAYAFRR